jgi:membrane-associated phospholipid phosphatase
MARWKSYVWTVVMLGLASPIPAQEVSQDDDWMALQWWHPLAAAAGIGALTLLDEPMAELIHNHRSDSVDDFGTIMAGFSDDWVIRIITGELVTVGLVTRDASVASTGLRVITAHVIGGVLIKGGKWMFGRGRPSANLDDAFDFEFFNGSNSNAFPSGAAVQSFALATTLADEIDHPVASVALYSAAGLNAWSRLNSNRHWVSDMALGDVMGMTLARLMNGRWRLFGLRPLELWAGPDGARFGWRLSF